MRFFAFLTLLMCLPLGADATIYIYAIDPENGAVGAAVITSGPITAPNRIMNARAGAGILGWGGNVVRPPRPEDETILGLMADRLAASEIENRVRADVGDGYYRLGFVTEAFEIGMVLPPSGCPVPECGFRRERDFLILGGGLEAGVLDAATAAFAKQSTHLSLACRLFRGLSEIAAAGGETKQFTSTQIIVDQVRTGELLSTGNHLPGKSEAELLEDLRAKLRASGEECAP